VAFKMSIQHKATLPLTCHVYALPVAGLGKGDRVVVGDGDPDADVDRDGVDVRVGLAVTDGVSLGDPLGDGVTAMERVERIGTSYKACKRAHKTGSTPQVCVRAFVHVWPPRTAGTRGRHRHGRRG
jgi:hypothetical protein